MQKNEKLLRLFGMIILILFGLYTIYGAITSYGVMEEIKVSISYLETFIRFVVLTGANPLTIVFWSGVFSAKIAEEKFTSRDEFYFGAGAVISTLLFLLVVALLGQTTSNFIGPGFIRGLNIIVGIILIYFGVKLYKNQKTTGGNELESTD